MSRPARKPQLSMFEDGPRACLAPQPTKPTTTTPHLHLCEAPGCGAWGAFGFGVCRGVPGHWLCNDHRGLAAKIIGDLR